MTDKLKERLNQEHKDALIAGDCSLYVDYETWLEDRVEELEKIYNEYGTLKKATERLSAKDAIAIWRVTHPSLGDALKAYADILEDKDETRP